MGTGETIAVIGAVGVMGYFIYGAVSEGKEAGGAVGLPQLGLPQIMLPQIPQISIKMPDISQDEGSIFQDFANAIYVGFQSLSSQIGNLKAEIQEKATAPATPKQANIFSFLSDLVGLGRTTLSGIKYGITGEWISDLGSNVLGGMTAIARGITGDVGYHLAGLTSEVSKIEAWAREKELKQVSTPTKTEYLTALQKATEMAGIPSRSEIGRVSGGTARLPARGTPLFTPSRPAPAPARVSTPSVQEMKTMLTATPLPFHEQLQRGLI